MMKEEDLGYYDWLCISTNPLLAMQAAIEASKGKKVLQLETSGFYGGDPMIEVPKNFIIDRIPLLCFAKGPMIEGLRSSGAAEHVDFTPIEGIYFHYGGEELRVPFTREDVFSSTSFTLLEKRRLMKLLKENDLRSDKPFLEYLREVLGLSEKLALMIIHAVCLHPTEHTLSGSEGVRLCRRFAESSGVYGSSPLLYPAYGAREVVQAFSRVCAVHGGLQVLRASNIQIECRKVTFSFDDCKYSASFGLLIQDDDGEKYINVAKLITQESCPEQRLDIKHTEAGPIFELTLNSNSCCCPAASSIVYRWYHADSSSSIYGNVFN